MAKKQNSGAGDDVLLKVKVVGGEAINETRNDAKKLNDELGKGANVDVSKPTKSLKQQLREATVEAQKLFAEGKKGTQEYANAATKVQSLKNDIDELNKTFKAFDPDNKFRVFSNAAAAGAKAVQGYAGAMAFLGVNSEDATQTLAKLQGIMAFADAIDSLHDLKDSYNDLLGMLGLTSTATKSLATEQAASSTISQAAAVSEIATEEELAALRLRIAAADVAAAESMAIIRAEGLNAAVAETAAEKAYLSAAAERAALTKELAVLEGTLTVAQEGAAVATGATTVATEGLIVAEEGATVASFTLGGALKAIGIGLIISAIAYLITNFKQVKKAITDLFPALGDTGKIFDKVKEIFFGVGNVIIQYLVAPIKTFIKLIQGDFKGAVEEIKNGLNVVKNYQDGANKEIAAQQEAARKERVKGEIETNERIIKERRALGLSTTALEVANKKREISILDAEDDNYKKDRADLESDITVIRNTELKKQSDLYRAKLKEDLDAIKANSLQNLEVIKKGSNNQRALAIEDVDFKYKKELELLNKRKSANANYNKDLANLTKARKVEEQLINKQYDDAIAAYSQNVNETYINDFDRKENEIKRRAEELLKNATASQKAAIQADTAFLIGRNTSQSLASQASINADTNLNNKENQYRLSEDDTPGEASAKINILTAARLQADEAAYNLRKAQLEGQYDELELLESQHERNKKDILLENSEARKEIDKKEAEGKLKLLDVVANASALAADLLGDSTIAGKIAAVASTTISTYLAAQQAYASQLTPGDPTSPFRAALAAGVAVAAGLANVKKILSVKVPGKSGGGGSTGGGSSAPVINSTVLNQDKNGSNDVANAIKDKDKNQKPLRAFIVTKDLEDQEKKAQYFNNQSTY